MGYNRQQQQMKKIFVLFVLLCTTTTLFAQRSGVEVIYGYLYVFPKELGFFEKEPVNIIEQLNSNSQYGYSTWRLPNKEELALLRANGFANNSTYMTQDIGGEGIVLLVTTKKEATAKDYSSTVSKIKNQTGYVDLGLSSGVMWAAQNYGDRKYRYTEIQGLKVPSLGQWQELERECTWTWDKKENGYIVKGKNSNAIFLKNTYGWIHHITGETCDDGAAWYWSSTYLGMKNDQNLYGVLQFTDYKRNSDLKMGENARCSVRLIK